MELSSAPPVLMLHALTSMIHTPWPSLGVPVTELADHLCALRKGGYQIVGMTEALDARAADPEARVVALTFDDGYIDLVTVGLNLLTSLGATGTLFVPTAHVGGAATWLGPRYDEAPPLMDWNQVRTVRDAGFEIGSHSATHPELDLLTADRVLAQVTESRAQLRSELGVSPTGFCYPHGYHNRQARSAVEAAGYRYAVEVGHTVPGVRHDRYRLPRLMVRPGMASSTLLAWVAGRPPRVVPAVKAGLRPIWREARRLRNVGGSRAR